MPTLGRQSVKKQEMSAISTCPSCGQNVPDSIIRCSCGAYLFSNFNLRTLLRMMRFPPLLVWIRSEVLRTLSWLPKARLKVIIIVYCLSVVFACIYVPWRAALWSCEYSLIWSPPRCKGGRAVVDYARVILEIVALTALGAIGLTLSGDIWKRGKKEIDLTQVMEKKK